MRLGHDIGSALIIALPLRLKPINKRVLKLGNKSKGYSRVLTKIRPCFYRIKVEPIDPIGNKYSRISSYDNRNLEIFVVALKNAILEKLIFKRKNQKL